MDQTRHKADGYYHSLARNMILAVLIVSITPMLLVSATILYQFHQSYQAKVYAHLEELVEKHRQNIDNFLKEKLADIQALAKTFSYEELSDESFLRDRLEVLQEEYGAVFVDLGVVNARGVQMAYAGPFKLGKALYSEAEWFREVMKRDYYISDVFLGLRGLPHFILAVRQNWGGEPWILRSTIDFVAFTKLVENIRIGETGIAYILNRRGEFQTKTVLDALPSKGPCSDFVETGKPFTEEDVCVSVRGDGMGSKNLYVGAALKGGDWLLMYRQRASDAFSDFQRTLKVTLVIILLGSLGIASMAVLVSKRMVNRIAEVDSEKQLMNEQIVETGKLASVGELAAGIAHEINNPVAIMVEEAGWIEDLLEEEEFKESENLQEFARALKQIRTQGKRCKEITHKLLSFARKTDSRVEEVRPKELIEEIVALSGQRAKYSNVKITTTLQKGLPALHVSQSELQQVFLNLINNALDAMEKKGGVIDIRGYLVGPYAVFEVADTGPGIPQANLARIFDPFFTTKPVGKGTGLGLSICYGIVKKLGGDIEVESVMDAGTTFRVKIPLEGDKGEGEASGPFARTEAKQGAR